MLRAVPQGCSSRAVPTVLFPRAVPTVLFLKCCSSGLFLQCCSSGLFLKCCSSGLFLRAVPTGIYWNRTLSPQCSPLLLFLPQPARLGEGGPGVHYSLSTPHGEALSYLLNKYSNTTLLLSEDGLVALWIVLRSMIRLKYINVCHRILGSFDRAKG